MKIHSADWQDYQLPLRHPWLTSQGTLTRRHGRLLRLLDTDGRIGWGDAAPLPEFGIDEAAATAFAEECAYLDLSAQRSDQPLNAWLSGRPAQQSIAVNANLGALSDKSPAQARQAIAQGYRILKFKVGTAPLLDEINALKQLGAGLSAGIRLRLDANRAWSTQEARNFIESCQNLPIEGLEEPLLTPGSAALDTLQVLADFPLAIDESIELLAEKSFFQHPPVRRLILKPARHGGMLASIEIALRASMAGIECIVTSALESACGTLACAHLAAAIAPHSVHGLATGEWFAHDTGIGAEIREGRFCLPTVSGLGFQPNR